ncbi:MAG: hypothetical protein IPJ78_18965 [Gemmatimonadetes bacterium]|nr:hypothetical protein [Gemmatimonadota bacterium]
MLTRPSYRAGQVPLIPALLVAAANAFIGVREQGGDNRGQMVEHFLRGVSLPPGQPWCAAFVHHVGHAAHYDHLTRRSSWPLPATGSCEALARAARDHGALRLEPYVGDVFLLYSRTRQRFIHTGIVVGVLGEERVHEQNEHTCLTVEGNTNDDGSSNGHTTLRKVRTFREADGHRFIRWTEMDRRAMAA